MSESGWVAYFSHVTHVSGPRCRFKPLSCHIRHCGTTGPGTSIAPQGTVVAHITKCMQDKIAH